MNFPGFSATDFNVFKINGLEPRMDALINRIRPKLEWLGTHFSGELSALLGQEVYPHIAKHARRTVNPPNDTWVAFSNNRRGYKMVPHFQIGLWETHLFVWYAVIYEAPMKPEIGQVMKSNIEIIQNNIPSHFVWSIDHMKPDATLHSELNEEDFTSMFERLQTVKKSEILCGIQIPREQAIEMTGDQLLSVIHDVFVQLIPLYKMN
ncbi:YktB family protein [Peribacillus alkalitolerans]|uniref:YktB family protein n=1 Tax=Peribacillus alkalitolerans TaxID=1550385 RepID=UPI0013D5FE6A|nr:DUF1054 domain-containing protein [Peribacillus alkalitolerans]